MSALDFAARGMARRLDADLREGLSALTLATPQAAAGMHLARVIPAGGEVRIASLNGARFRRDDAATLTSGFAGGENVAWFIDAGGTAWANCNAEPTLGEFGLDPRNGPSNILTRTRMQMLIDWVRFRGLTKYHLAPDIGQPYVIDQHPFIHSGTRTNPVTVVIDGTIENDSGPDANDISFVGGCIGLGEHHPAYFHAGWPGGTAITRYVIDTPAIGAMAVTASANGSNRDDCVAAIQAAQANAPDGKVRVFVFSGAGYEHGSGATIQQGFTLTETSAAVGADGIIALHDPVTETVAGPWYVTLADNPGTIHSALGTRSQYVCAHVNIVGNGALKSTWSAFGRTGTYRVNVDLGRLEAANGFYVNAIYYSHFSASHVEVHRKFVDIAGNSGFSSFNAKTWVFDGPGIDDVPAVAFGENSHDCEVGGKDMFLPQWNQASSVLFYGASRRCGVRLSGGLFAPQAPNNPIYANSTAVIGTEPDRSDNWLDIAGKITFGSHQRDVSISGPAVKRFNLRRVRLPGGGSVNGESVRDSGTGTIYDAGVEAGGTLQVESDSGGGAVLNRPRFAQGYGLGHTAAKVGSGTILTAASSLLASAAVRPTWKTVTASSAGTDVIATLVPPGAISPRTTFRLGIRAQGHGSGGTKTIVIKADTTAIATITLAAGNNVFANIDVNLFASNNSRLSCKGTIVNGAVASTSNAIITGLNMPANGLTISIDAYKAVAGDVLQLEPYWIEAARPDELVSG